MLRSRKNTLSGHTRAPTTRIIALVAAGMVSPPLMNTRETTSCQAAG